MSALDSHAPSDPVAHDDRVDLVDLDLDLVGLGETSLDHVLALPQWPAKNDKLALDAREEHAGGQIATALLAAARLGLRCCLISSVGADSAGRQALAPLVAGGVDCGEVRVREGIATRTAWALVASEDGSRCILSERAAALALDPNELRDSKAQDALDRARLLLVDTTDPAASLWAAKRVRAAGRPVILDADRDWPGADELLAVVDHPVLTWPLAEAWGGVDATIERMRGHGAELVIVTHGERGAIAWTAQEGRFDTPAFAVDVRDTTGAGDAFRGGLAWALSRGLRGRRAVSTASAVGALACRARGAQGSLPDAGEVEALVGTLPQPQSQGEPA